MEWKSSLSMESSVLIKCDIICVARYRTNLSFAVSIGKSSDSMCVVSRLLGVSANTGPPWAPLFSRMALSEKLVSKSLYPTFQSKWGN